MQHESIARRVILRPPLHDIPFPVVLRHTGQSFHRLPRNVVADMLAEGVAHQSASQDWSQVRIWTNRILHEMVYELWTCRIFHDRI